jgi:hypothetical protein
MSNHYVHMLAEMRRLTSQYGTKKVSWQWAGSAFCKLVLRSGEIAGHPFYKMKGTWLSQGLRGLISGSLLIVQFQEQGKVNSS